MSSAIFAMSATATDAGTTVPNGEQPAQGSGRGPRIELATHVERMEAANATGRLGSIGAILVGGQATVCADSNVVKY